METRKQQDADTRGVLLTAGRALVAENPDFSLQTLLISTGVTRARFRRCFADKEQLLAALTGEEVKALDHILEAAGPEAMRAAVGSDFAPTPAPVVTDAWLERRLRVFERALAGLEKRQEKSEQELARHLGLIGERLEALAAQPPARPEEAPAPQPEAVAETETPVPVSAPEKEALLILSDPQLSASAPLPAAPLPGEALAPIVENPVSEKEMDDFIAHARRVAQNAAANAQAAPPQRLRNLRWLAWSGVVLTTLIFCAGLLLVSGARGRTPPVPLPNAGVSHRQVAQTGIARVIALADSGDAAAQTKLALDYLKGQDVSSDDAAAKRWSQAAAAQGQPVAEYLLGALESDVDRQEAVRWFRAAAAQGNLKAMHNLAIAYAEGLGVEKDASQAVQWFARAAEEGYRDSEFDLAVLYERGDGVPQSARAALKWYLIAADRGDVPSAKRAAVLKQQIDPLEIKQASAEAASFEPKPIGYFANSAPDL